jgi:hypothetical protein
MPLSLVKRGTLSSNTTHDSAGAEGQSQGGSRLSARSNTPNTDSAEDSPLVLDKLGLAGDEKGEGVANHTMDKSALALHQPVCTLYYA